MLFGLINPPRSYVPKYPFHPVSLPPSLVAFTGVWRCCLLTAIMQCPPLSPCGVTVPSPKIKGEQPFPSLAPLKKVEGVDFLSGIVMTAGHLFLESRFLRKHSSPSPIARSSPPPMTFRNSSSGEEGSTFLLPAGAGNPPHSPLSRVECGIT